MPRSYTASLKFRDFLKAWGPVICWMALMFVGSSDLFSGEHTSRFLTPLLRWLNPEISPAAIAQAHLIARKAAHVTEYAILASLIYRALRGVIDSFWLRGGAALVPAFLFAGLDEFHQSFVPSRTSSLGDVGIDCAGALLGVLVCGAFLAGTRLARRRDRHDQFTASRMREL